MDVAGTPLAIVRPDGEIVHATPALLALVALPQGNELLSAAQALAREIGKLLIRRPEGALPAPSASVSTPNATHELRATLVQPMLLGPAPLVLVAVTAPPGSGDTPAMLAQRFGLTDREAEVAVLVARGERDRVIAQALGISHHTVRRHVERVLAKLNVHHRAAVARVIQG